jgi:hypothetical protein
MKDSWKPLDNKAENGFSTGRGSEGGLIVRDEEHALGARVTLEKECEAAPFAITCGIYGWMMHTCFLSEEGEAGEQHEDMKRAIGELLERVEGLANDVEAQRALLMEGCAKLVERFP